MRGGRKRLIKILIAAVIVLAAVSLWYGQWLAPKKEMTYGATFSTVYAEYLGLDWQNAYLASMDDLGIQAWRLPVYWSEVEPEIDQYSWEELDWMMDEAAARDVAVTMAIGLKVPRWPECFLPEWSEELSEEAFDDRMMLFLEQTVERYKDHPALDRWQVENEPFFPFGECPVPSPERIDAEYELVRQLDPNHVIQSTTSGEQSLWILSVSRIDVLGVSLYREVYTPIIGPFVFPHSPLFYSLQRALAEPFVDKVIVSELQAEPWFESGLYEQERTVTQLYEAFPVEDLDANVRFAQSVGVDEVYFWGVEWWMWLKQMDEPRLWDGARAIIAQ